MKNGQKISLCDENPNECRFDLKTYLSGAMVHNDATNINCLVLYTVS